MVYLFIKYGKIQNMQLTFLSSKLKFLFFLTILNNNLYSKPEDNKNNKTSNDKKDSDKNKQDNKKTPSENPINMEDFIKNLNSGKNQEEQKLNFKDPNTEKLISEAYEAKKKYYTDEIWRNSLFMTGVNLVLKTIIGAVFGTITKDLIDWFKDKFHPLILIESLEKGSIDLITPYNKTTLYLTENQRNFEDYLSNSLLDFIKSGKNKPTEPIILFGGESGTGKSASMFSIMNTLFQYEIKNKKNNIFNRFAKFILPNMLQGIFKVRETKDGIYLVMSGAYFYNYSNEQEKAASLFSNILDILADHIRNNPRKYFIIAIDEAEIITQEPFARILKVFTTQLSQLNKDKKHGYGLILMSTNYINQVSETLSRRVFVLEFNTPSADIKLKTFLLYLEKHMKNNLKQKEKSDIISKEYTETIVNYINKWIKYCENFSHSDMENLVWLLKLKYTTTNVITTLEDLLNIIYIEWKKRNIIVNKTKPENLQLQELELLINKIKNYKNKTIKSLIEDEKLNFTNLIVAA